jgi:hypothetical protein
MKKFSWSWEQEPQENEGGFKKSWRRVRKREGIDQCSSDLLPTQVDTVPPFPKLLPSDICLSPFSLLFTGENPSN